MTTDARATRRLSAVIAVAVIVCGLGAALLALRRHRGEEAERARLARAAEQGPEVRVARVAPGGGRREITLPGDVRAFWQTTIFARVAGYVRELNVDKGDRVRKGQLIARIASPETDQQVLQARSTLEVRRRLATRVRKLAPTGYVSQQELDQANSDLAVAEAELRRVRALQEYEVVRAPFEGIVTARHVDPGALLSASATGQPIVDLADVGRVRLLVYVGQDVAPFVRVGDEGTITIDQHPEVRIAAHVRRLTDALDPRTRTMLVELWPDEAGAFRLVSGLFVHVALRVEVPVLPSIPAEALAARGERLQVALVQDGKLHFADVEPGLNDGKRVQIRKGLRGDEVIALSPPSDLGDGAPVRPLAPGQVAADGRGTAPGERSARDGEPPRAHDGG